MTHSLYKAIASLISKYSIDTRTIGRLEIISDANPTVIDKMTDELLSLFKDPSVAVGYSRGKATDAFFQSINWIESLSWDGRNALLFTGSTGADSVAILVGSHASIVVERMCTLHCLLRLLLILELAFFGVHTASRNDSGNLRTALEGAYLSYTDKFKSALRK